MRTGTDTYTGAIHQKHQRLSRGRGLQPRQSHAEAHLHHRHEAVPRRGSDLGRDAGAAVPGQYVRTGE